MKISGLSFLPNTYTAPNGLSSSTINLEFHSTYFTRINIHNHNMGRMIIQIKTRMNSGSHRQQDEGDRRWGLRAETREGGSQRMKARGDRRRVARRRPWLGQSELNDGAQARGEWGAPAPWEMVVGTGMLQKRVRAGRDPGRAAMGRGGDRGKLQVEESAAVRESAGRRSLGELHAWELRASASRQGERAM
jgi:hypothetical protein